MSSSKPADESRALATVPRYLRSGVRSTCEVVSYLTRRGLSSQRAARVAAAYRERGLLDDRAAARLWAGHWARQGYASEAIRLKLSVKGFADELIKTTITQFVPPSDDEARARLVVARRVHRAIGSLARARVARALASRGFDSVLIERVLTTSSGSSDPDVE